MTVLTRAFAATNLNINRSFKIMRATIMLVDCKTGGGYKY